MLETYLQRTATYLQNLLIPFWAERYEDKAHGGILANYDAQGRRTEVTDKAMLAQGRAIVTLSHAMRLGWNWPNGHGVVHRGIDHLFRVFRDTEHDGYVWMTAEDGRPIDDAKVIYGHSFLIYALAEHALLTGDTRSRAEACRLFTLLMDRAADIRYGGFYEHFDRQFHLIAVRHDGLIHKSLDVHMHLMEAFTSLYELTGEPRHRQALLDITGLIFDRMIDAQTGVGISIFQPDWTPIPNIQLGTLWGADRFDPTGKPSEITSYGHNIELAWLYLHSLDILGIPREEGAPRVLPIFAHTAHDGVDWDYGGLYVEGHRQYGPTEQNKEFWQQAEALVGFLDAYAMTGDATYLRAFVNIHDFIFTHLICWEHGEWYPLADRHGTVLRDALGYHWKVGYHTIRAMCETVKRLRVLTSSDTRPNGR